MTGASGTPVFVVVIRAAGERTFDACKTLVLKQVPHAVVHVVDERPFEAALRKCYRIGIETSAEWMVTLDADVLLRDEAINELLAEAMAMPPNHFQIEGMVYDKLTNRVRWAGYRCYRVQHLTVAECLIPPDRQEIRPESTTLERMAARGHPSRRSCKVYGIHDFEQSFSDIYRKTRVHSVKHQSWLYNLLPQWKIACIKDPDFRVALRAAADGLSDFNQSAIDARWYRTQAEVVLRELGLSEKIRLDPASVTKEYVEAVIGSVLDSPDISWLVHDGDSPSERFHSRLRRLGALRIAPYMIGAVMVNIGTLLKRIAERSGKPRT